ncbi:MAG: hypothetical protein F4Y34_08365 [Gammaproteobacteria bacterium]|nr:hypothetical protein [Gammaproteobacteria bacterium]
MDPSRKQVPTVDRAAVIAAALGLEFYLGPPRKSEYRSRIQEIAAALGLPADASAEEILAEIRRLADRCRRIDETLAEIRRELAALRSARI